LDLLEASEFDVIITDVNLPELDGYELARRVRQLKAGPHVAVVAVTGRPIAEEEGVAREAGCDACLAKPFNIQALAEVVRTLKRNE
jgi:two-component system CheB/CheR fusion protein